MYLIKDANDSFQNFSDGITLPATFAQEQELTSTENQISITTTTQTSEEMTSILFSNFYTLPPDSIEERQDDEQFSDDSSDFTRHYDLERARYTSNVHHCKRECKKGECSQSIFIQI